VRTNPRARADLRERTRREADSVRKGTSQVERLFRVFWSETWRGLPVCAFEDRDQARARDGEDEGVSAGSPALRCSETVNSRGERGTSHLLFVEHFTRAECHFLRKPVQLLPLMMRRRSVCVWKSTRHTSNKLPTTHTPYLQFQHPFATFATMFEATADEFPFVEDLPKREKSRWQKYCDAMAEFAEVSRQEGGLVHVSMAANFLNVSRTRIDELCNAGILKRFSFGGHVVISVRSLKERAESKLLKGRPKKAA